MQPDVQDNSAPKPTGGKNTAGTPREWAAYPLALIAGYNVFETAVRKACYKNIASQGLFNDLQNTRKQEYQALFKTAQSHPDQNMTYAIKALETDYRLHVKERFQILGMHGAGDYWQVLKRNQKQDVLMLAATVSGVVLGALLTISDHSWVQKLGSGAKKEDDPQRSV